MMNVIGNFWWLWLALALGCNALQIVDCVECAKGKYSSMTYISLLWSFALVAWILFGVSALV